MTINEAKLAYVRTIRSQRRNGWVAMWNEYRPKRADGAPDMRFSPRYKGRELHIGPNGERRYYVRGVLRAEREAAR